jgi:dihydrofolate reductase
MGRTICHQQKAKKLIISAIVAVSNNGVIGLNGQIPWYLPADLKYFKKTTLGFPVIMGRKSFISIGRPLPGRENIVVSRDMFFVASGCTIVRTIEEAIEYAKETGKKEVFIIGGGEIYKQSQGWWDRIYLTRVDLDTQGDVFFEEPDWDEWQLESEEIHLMDAKNEYNYRFLIFNRRK